MKYLKTNEEIWNPFKKDKPKPSKTIAESRKKEMDELKESVDSINKSISSTLPDVESISVNEIPTGISNGQLHRQKILNYQELNIKLKKSAIDGYLYRNSIDKSIIGDHFIKVSCLWSDQEDKIEYIELDASFELNGVFGEVGIEDTGCIRDRSGKYKLIINCRPYRDGRLDQTLHSYLCYILRDLISSIKKMFDHRLVTLLTVSNTIVEKNKRELEFTKNLDRVKECFYDIVDTSVEHNIFLNKDGGITCYFGIAGIHASSTKNKFTLNDVLVEIFNRLSEAKPRVNDIVGGSEFTISLANDKITILIS